MTFLKILLSAVLATSAVGMMPTVVVAQVPAQRPAPRTAVAPASPDIFLLPITGTGSTLSVGVPANLTRREGYDNQPSFAADSRQLYYTANLGEGHTDIYAYDFSTGLTAPAKHTAPESEYSAFPEVAAQTVLVIRVEADSTQRLWRMSLKGGDDQVLFPDVKPVGYFAKTDDSTMVMFVLGSPATLQVGIIGQRGATTVASNIGRSLHRIPGTTRASFVQKGPNGWYVMQLDPHTRKVDTLVQTLARSEDMAWIDSTTMVMGQGSKLFAYTVGAANWVEVADFSYAHLSGITRLAVSPNKRWIAVVADVVHRAATTPTPVYADHIDEAAVRNGIGILAADSMEGRYTGSRGGARAAEWIAKQFQQAGLVPAGDSGSYQQWIPLQAAASGPTSMPGANAPGGNRSPAPSAQRRPAAVASWDAWNALEPDKRLRASNVVGVLPGSDPVLRDEVVLVTAHYDHIGFGRAVDGDSINNGADDDASGVIATIELAKALRNGPRPKRTIVFMAITGEEVGGFGTRWYISHPVRPLEKTVVDLNIEMIGNADSLAGGFGKAWLTGYERSTMGDLLADNGIPLVLDPRPTQNFFERSDNAAFARIGIPAHSLSSYNLQTPYHHPKDEPAVINVPHMVQVISASARALRLLADGPRPVWHPGGQPAPRR